MLAPVCRGREETDGSRAVGGCFNKQESLLMRLVWGGHKMSRCFLPTHQNLKSLHEGLNICHPGGLDTTLLSQGCILEISSHYWYSGENNAFQE